MARKKKDSDGKRKADATDVTGPADFESSLEQLELIVAELESGQLSLTESIERYEKGVGILHRCHATLDRARQKIELLTAVDESGEAQTAPFDSSADQSATDQNSSPGRKPDSRESQSSAQDVDDGTRLF